MNLLSVLGKKKRNYLMLVCIAVVSKIKGRGQCLASFATADIVYQSHVIR